MNGYDTYRVYTALNLYFFGKYDYFKYGDEVKGIAKRYENASDKVKFMFDRLGKKFYDRPDMENYLVSNLIGRQKGIGFVGEVLGAEPERIYKEWLGRTQSYEYLFISEIKRAMQEVDNFNQLFLVGDGQHPEIFKAVVRGDVSLETFSLLNLILDFVPNIDAQLIDDGSWNSLGQKAVRYTPFLQRLNIDVVSLRNSLRTAVVD